ncbi:hypothetical protein SAMN05216243_3266 [Sediminibacillus albus]|uniref:Uncharacterized protein n=1 Tax=Sediminibacillus albus TaxID=407036 RepID=A0A1G9C617_9BACI|nr:hypothetical protein SAMN05216243_3266 [Sediminibacillus albus]
MIRLFFSFAFILLSLQTIILLIDFLGFLGKLREQQPAQAYDKLIHCLIPYREKGLIIVSDFQLCFLGHYFVDVKAKRDDITDKYAQIEKWVINRLAEYNGGYNVVLGVLLNG